MPWRLSLRSGILMEAVGGTQGQCALCDMEPNGASGACKWLMRE